MSVNWKRFIMPFGKHKGDTLYMIYLNDPKYIKWLADNADSNTPADVGENIEDALAWIYENNHHVLE
jgi:uncharacterized protein (DUF3820 family)